MTHRSLGAGAEFDVVRALLARWGDVASGIGDDAALLDVPAGARLVVSTDTSVEDEHFRRAWLTPSEIGWRATTSALSDLAAMGAAPLGVLLALTVPPAWRASLDAIADGIGSAVQAAGTQIVGGDLTSGRALSLTITVLGAATRPVGRDGARAGDAVYVTGALGASRRAWLALERGDAPEPGERARFAHPVARIRAGRLLAERGATAMIDVSDGLAADLRHIAAASGARIRLDASRLPRSSGASVEDALASGEEYELALTAPASLPATQLASDLGVALTVIGVVERGACEVVLDGARVDLPPGYDHFSP